MSNNTDSANKPQSITVLSQFLKDLSFENPANGPLFVVKTDKNPSMNMNIHIDIEKDTTEETHFQVSLTLKAISKLQETPLFIIDVTYTGLFKIVGFEDTLLEQILNVQCPTLLFPYVRRIVSEKIIEGGFPPLFINPIDFYAIYTQKKQELNKKSMN